MRPPCVYRLLEVEAADVVLNLCVELVERGRDFELIGSTPQLEVVDVVEVRCGDALCV